MSFKQCLDNEKRCYKFASLMIELPERLCDDIISWGFDNIPNDSLVCDPNSPLFGREDDTHITVIYGIHTDDVNDVDIWFRNEKPFECTLGKIDILSKKPQFDVLVVSVKSKGLHLLNSKMRTKLEVTENYPQYIPHVTIAYLQKGEGDKFIGNKAFEGEKFTVKEVMFTSRLNKKTPIVLGVS